MRGLFATRYDVSATIARLFAAVVFFPHGLQKVFGIWGDPGPVGAYHMLTGMHIPGWLAGFVMAAEFLGPIGLFLGLFTRVAAFGLFCDMIGAVALVHWRYGFFMNWTGAQAGEGFEYHLLALGLLLVIMIRGSVDLAITRSAETRQPVRRRERAREPASV